MSTASTYELTSLITLELSGQSMNLLAQLACKGIYGRTAHEVAERLLDQSLQTFVVAPSFEIERNRVKETD